MCGTGKVSVIVPNHGRDLSILKESLEQSTYKNYELLVIDLGFERSVQRNIGIRNATGEYILFLDSDTAVTSHLIENCVDLMGEYDSLFIPELIMTEGFFGYLRNWERQFYAGSLVDVVRFIKTDKCPLFDETMSGPEDSDFDRKVKGKKGLAEEPLLHFDNVGVVEYLKKKAYYSKSMRKFETKNPGDKILDFKYRCWTVFTENGKWKRLLKAPHLTACLVLLLLTRGIIYLTKR